MGRATASLAALVAASVGILAGASPAPGESQAAYAFRPVLRAAFVTHVAAPRSAPGRLYVVQQNGRIRLAVGGKLRRKAFLDLRGRVVFGREQGMLSLAFHPAYARNRLVYVSYVGAGNITRVAEYRTNRAGTFVLPGTRRLLLSVPQPGDEHKGGQLAFGPDGKLYVGLGDGECCDDPANRAQNVALPFGKLLRLDVSVRRPAAEMVALGLRNPWRFSFDRANGDLYLGDVGAGLWEEIDVIPRAELGRARQLRVGRVGGARDQGEQTAEPARPPRLSGTRLRARPGLLDHRRLRLPRVPRSRGPRPLLLRRLLQRHDLEPQDGKRLRDRRPARGFPDQRLVDVRRGRARRALCGVQLNGKGLPARFGLTRPIP